MNTTMKSYLRTLLLLVILWLGRGISYADSWSKDSLADNERIPLYIVPDGKYEITDSVFFERANTIPFQVNRYDLNYAQFQLEKFWQDVDHGFSNDLFSQSCFIVRSASSPEGIASNNTHLANRRAESVETWIANREIHFERVDLAIVPEDYQMLLHLMKQQDDPDFNRVKQIIEKNQNNSSDIKWDIQQLDGYRVWERLLSRYFPEIRYVRFMIVMPNEHYVLLSRKYPDLERFIIPQYILPDSIMPETIEQEEEIEEPVEEIVPEPTIVVIDPVKERREMISLKTNLLQDFAYIPGYDGFVPLWNIQAEYYPMHGHYTFEGQFDIPWSTRRSSEHKYFQARNYQLEVRRYFNRDGVFRGWYVGPYAHAVKYGIGFNKDKGWQGEGWGAGLGLGYVMPLSRNQHWRLEFGLQGGIFRTKYDPYVYGCPVEQKEDGLYYYNWVGEKDDFKERQYRFTWFGPTRVGITITRDVFFRKKR